METMEATKIRPVGKESLVLGLVIPSANEVGSSEILFSSSPTPIGERHAEDRVRSEHNNEATSKVVTSVFIHGSLR